MSFSRSNRFVQSKKGINPSESAGKSVKMCNESRNKSYSTYSKRNEMLPRQSPFTNQTNFTRSLPRVTVDKEATRMNNEDMNLSDSFSSCISSSVSFYDVQPEIDYKGEKNVNITTERKNNGQDFGARLTKQNSSYGSYYNKKSSNIESLMKNSYLEIQNVACRTANNIRNEWNRKLDSVVQELIKSQDNLLEEMNRHYLHILNDFNTTISEAMGRELRLLNNDVKRLEAGNRRLSIHLEKSKQRMEDRSNTYKDLMKRAEQKINELEVTMRILKEELKALQLKEHLQHIIRQQQK